MDEVPAPLPPGVIGGTDTPALTRATFPALIKMMFMVGALETHRENGNAEAHADVAEKLNQALTQLFMMHTQLHGGDGAANFDYWMNQVVPEPPPPVPSQVQQVKP